MKSNKKGKGGRKCIALLAAIFVAFLASFAPAQAQDFPAGVVLEGQRSGYRMDFSSGSKQLHTGTQTTTHDAFDFGFTSKYVRLCLLTSSVSTQVAYIRFGTTVTLDTSTLATSAAGNRLTVPASSSAAFIGGVTGRMTERAMPLAAKMTSTNMETHCMTQPWQTQGLVVHVPSGLATLDIMAFR